MVNFPTKHIAGVKSEVLVLGAMVDTGVVLLNTEQKVENGERIG